MITQRLSDGSINPEWLTARTGKISASTVYRLMGSDAVKITYLSELLAERLAGGTVDRYVSPAMQRGSEGEASTIMRYELEVVGEFGSVSPAGWEEVDGLGATPDGLIGNAGMVEVKRPLWKNVVKERWGADIVGKDPAVNKEYWWQCQAQMAVFGRQWCDLVYEAQDLDSYPHMPAHLTLWVRRIARDEDAIEALKTAVLDANDTLREIEHGARIPPESRIAVAALVEALRSAASHAEIDEIMERAEAMRITNPKDRDAIDEAAHKRTLELPTLLGA